MSALAVRVTQPDYSAHLPQLTGSLSWRAPGSLANQLKQVQLDLFDSPALCAAIAAQQDQAHPDFMQTEAIPVDPTVALRDEAPNHASYLKFALCLLATCCDDLIAAQKIRANPESRPRALAEAEFLHDGAVAWLRGYPTRITFEVCARLLEQELRLQSLDQIEIPNIEARRAELAEFIIADPVQAADLLKHYATLFAPNAIEMVFDSESPEPAHGRAPAMRG